MMEIKKANEKYLIEQIERLYPEVQTTNVKVKERSRAFQTSIKQEESKIAKDLQIFVQDIPDQINSTVHEKERKAIDLNSSEKLKIAKNLVSGNLDPNTLLEFVELTKLFNLNKKIERELVSSIKTLAVTFGEVYIYFLRKIII